jgi:hypothetical protein
MVSGAGMAITMVGLGIYLEVGEGSSDLSWPPLLLILGYIVSIQNSGHQQGGEKLGNCSSPPPLRKVKKKITFADSFLFR